ncbi:hypothetical protein V6Z11_A08G256000 [Gossypium hirsutum]
MSCLLPQFKCQPDTFSINFRTHHSHHSRHKESICFRAHCVLSTTSPSASTRTTSVLDVEKLRLPFFEAQPNSIVADRERTYIGGTGPPSEACFGTTLGTENLLTSDEAVIAAAAAEAVALARAAVKRGLELLEIPSKMTVNLKKVIQSKIPQKNLMNQSQQMKNLNFLRNNYLET